MDNVLIFFLRPGFDEGKIKVLLGLGSADEEAVADFDLDHGDTGFPVLLLLSTGEKLGLGFGEVGDEPIEAAFEVRA